MSLISGTHTHPHSVPKLISATRRFIGSNLHLVRIPPQKAVAPSSLVENFENVPRQHRNRHQLEGFPNKQATTKTKSSAKISVSVIDPFGRPSVTHLAISHYLNCFCPCGFRLVSSPSRLELWVFPFYHPPSPHITGLPLTCQCQRQHILSATWRHPVLTCERL